MPVRLVATLEDGVEHCMACGKDYRVKDDVVVLP